MPAKTIHLVALGCPKNRVDSERMAGLARRLGYRLTDDPAEAEVIVANTCGFIGEAVEESLGAVLELGQYRTGRCSTLVLAGCLAQRFPEELATELPEVTHLIGTADLERLEQILAGAPAPRLGVGQPRQWHEERWERPAETRAPHLAYLKVAEGCDRPCAFCIIPRLRGPQRSRGLDSLRAEARALVDAGARELVLVAQDTTAYGRDLSPRRRLTDLLGALDQTPGLRWLRLMYTYPTEVSDDLLRAMAELQTVVPYLDVPLQHVDDAVLRRMKRGYGGRQVEALVERARRLVPGIALRTTLISGHPGETEAAHRALADFLRRHELEHVGVFPYSAEEGTDSFSQPDPLPEELCRERAGELMELQRGISRRLLARLRGTALTVLVDGESEESEYLLAGRHPGQAPEVDGLVVLSPDGARCAPGDLVRARVEDSADYDLVARIESVL